MKKGKRLHLVEEKTLNHIKHNQMISAHEKILLGVSGGADSMCLLFLLKELKDILSCSIEVVHVNHMLRQNADRDQKFVESICEKLGVVCHSKKVDVPALVKEQGLSLEEAARLARYEAFEQVRSHILADKIAVAHHAEDQAETMLFHLCRGTGLEGLGGMKPVRDRIIRPMLVLSRQQIEDYLQEKGIDFVTDETNADNQYARNRLRNEVFPLLEEEICQSSAIHMASAAMLVQQAQDYLTTQIQEAVSLCLIKKEDSCQIYLAKMNKLHPYLQGEVVKVALESVAGSKKDLSMVHMDAVRALESKQVGSKVNLPYQMVARKSYETIEIEKEIVQETQQEREEIDLLLFQSKEDLMPGEKRISLWDGSQLLMRVFPWQEGLDIPTKAYTKWLDYDKIEGSLRLRTTNENDYFFLDDTHKKLVKDYMKDEKIPLKERTSQLVVASGNHMIYFLGKRISQYVKVTNQTEKILELSICPAYEGGTVWQKQ